MDLAKYRDLFVHRADVYAVQQDDGRYFPAGDHHWDNEQKRMVYDSYYELDDDALSEHLAGFASYGAYVINPANIAITTEGFTAGGYWPDVVNSVSYVVFDLDTYTPEAFTWLVHCCTNLVSQVLGEPAGSGPDPELRCLMMENSGGKGFHAWLFLDAPVSAAKVRRWLARDFSREWSVHSDDFDGTPLEIFPKQDEVPEGQFGNLVKLPFGVHAKSGNRSEIVVTQGWANDVDSVVKLPTRLIPEVEVEQPIRAAGHVTRGEPGTTRFPCVDRLLDEGAPKGCRDKAMYFFARYAKGAGLPQDMVLDWCLRTNLNFDPPMSDREVNIKVQSAFRNGAPHPSCNEDWLPDFCPGGENCFAPGSERSAEKATARRKSSVDDASDYLSLSPEERRRRRQGEA